MVEALGHKLVTHHPVIEPATPPSQERKFAMQGRHAKAGLPKSPTFNIGREPLKL